MYRLIQDVFTDFLGSIREQLSPFVISRKKDLIAFLSHSPLNTTGQSVTHLKTKFTIELIMLGIFLKFFAHSILNNVRSSMRYSNIK